MLNLPSGIKVENLINDLRIFSWEAYEIFHYYSQILKETNNKSNILQNNNVNDPVTLADLKVNDLIIRRIKKKYSNINWEILSEENVKIESINCDADSDWLWVFDPLDGTKDFIQGTGNYAMHLALNFKKKPLIGIVLIPMKEELWISNGDNVWCEKKNKQLINPICLTNKSLKEMTIVTSKNHRNETLRNLINKIGFKKEIVMGSIGCKIASIVRGESDIYISLSLPGKSSPKDWDFAAPESILNAAGGVITNLDNQELSYGKANFEQRGIIVATNDRETHGNICLEIKSIIERNGIFPL